MYLRTHQRTLKVGLMLLVLLGGLPGGAADAATPAPRATPPPPGETSFLANPLPGASPPPLDLVQRLRNAWEGRPHGYVPRTRHLNADGTPRYTNRLFLRSSPYLRQHAHNPVNWYPWGDEAFETARRLGRPVLLSVGYSTCHWCHVMEEESFEDEEIARYLNEHYVAIKVDREERPDIDSVYMAAVTRLTGSGGWPMTVWLTPERKPFYGGTYFPARDGERGARAGFLTVLRKIDEVYRDQPERVAQSADSLSDAVQAAMAAPSPSPELAEADVLRRAAAFSQAELDPINGGSKGAPKFPSGLPLRFLLRYHRRTGDPKVLHMASLTLEKMAAGGIHDQVGGGFHRYSTDDHWLVPHFEKMLYDNALLATAYLEAFQVSGREDLAGTARDILAYIDRDMTAPEGGFYSATDADSTDDSGARREGWFYTWTIAEVAAALEPGQLSLAERYYGLTAAGNLEGRNVLHLAEPPSAVAAGAGFPVRELPARIEAIRERLREARSRRPPPARDEKILAAWNGLTISAYARASLALDEPAYAATAERAASFVLDRMRSGNRLRRSYTGGHAEGDAYLDDYAFVIAGLLDLVEADGRAEWLEQAIRLDGALAQHYEDRQEGGFFLTSDDHEALLAREKPADDGAEPSGNSVQVLNLLRLYEWTADDRYRQRAEGALHAFAGPLQRTPQAFAEMLLAVDYHLDHPKEIVIVAPGGRSAAEPFLERLRHTFVPNRILAVTAPGESQQALARLSPLVAGKPAAGGKATAYVCERQVCQLPTTNPERFAEELRKVHPL